MKKILAVVIMLLLTPLPALAGNVTDFEGGTKEAVAVLGEPMFSDVINVTLPAECHIRKATMNVSAVVPDAGNPDCPESPSVWLNDTMLWQFNGTDYGELGMQDAFVNETATWESSFGPEGGTNTSQIRLPKKAVVQNATMEINASGPGEMVQSMNALGAAPGDSFGYSISNAGDVNGDGYDDVMVGAPNAIYGTIWGGRAYIYFGGPTMDSTPDVNLTAETGNDQFGMSVSTAGDVNKDGYDDVIVGAPQHNGAGSFVGSAYIFFGGAAMDSIPDVIFNGNANYDYFGFSVSCAGDVNKDGYDDVMVGAPYHDAGNFDSGRVYIYFGGATMDNTADVVMDGDGYHNYFGNSISDAGDVNGDGYDDVIVGAFNAGRAYIYFGGATMDNVTDVFLNGETATNNFGCSVSGAGNVNGDGYDDVIVGEQRNSLAGPNAGGAFIYLGGAGMDSAADVILTGEAKGDYFGNSVSGAGDVNKDGYDDVIAGSKYNNQAGNYAGRAYIFFGGPAMDVVADVTLSGRAGGDEYGSSVSQADDINKDGRPEIIIGAPYDDASFTDAGAAYTYEWDVGVRNLSVSLGQNSVWSHNGFFNGSNSTKDLSQALNGMISTNVIAGTDKYGNIYSDVPIQIRGEDSGNVTLSKLNITYNYTTAIPEFTDLLNSYILGHKSEKDANGNLTVQFKIKSNSSGRLKLLDLNMITDAAPQLLQAIPDAAMDEDSMVSDLVNLWDYFKDDFDGQQQLQFGLVSATNDTIVKVEIIGNQYLSVDALEGDPSDNWTGVVQVVVKATDHWGSARESNPFNVTVRNVPDPPSITSTPLLTGSGGQEYTYQVIAVDGDNDILTYSLSKKPQNMTINSGSGLISWVPSSGGKYDVSVSVTDGMTPVSQDFSILVPNRAPRITNTTIPNAFTGVAFVYDIPAVDDDGDSLGFTLLSQITGLSVDSSTGKLIFTPITVGDQQVSVTISDGTNSTTYDFTIRVLQSNRAPKFQSSPVTKAITGVPYVYGAIATDMDGDPLTYSFAASPSGMSVENATGKVTWTPDTAGNMTIQLKVSDGRGGDTIQEFVVRVTTRVMAKTDISNPSEGKSVKGKITISGTATKGTLAIQNIQIKIDSGDWANLTGNSTWQYSLDTTKLKDGKHTMQVRAYDGYSYSDPVNRTFVVNNAKSGGKGFIPGFAAEMAMATFSLALILLGRKKRAQG